MSDSLYPRRNFSKAGKERKKKRGSKRRDCSVHPFCGLLYSGDIEKKVEGGKKKKEKKKERGEAMKSLDHLQSCVAPGGLKGGGAKKGEEKGKGKKKKNGPFSPLLNCPRKRKKKRKKRTLSIHSHSGTRMKKKRKKKKREGRKERKKKREKKKKDLLLAKSVTIKIDMEQCRRGGKKREGRSPMAPPCFSNASSRMRTRRDFQAA